MTVRYEIVPGISTRSMQGNLPDEILKFVHLQQTPVGVFITPKPGVVFYAGIDFEQLEDDQGKVVTYYGLDAGIMGKVWFIDRFDKETSTSNFQVTI